MPWIILGIICLTIGAAMLYGSFNEYFRFRYLGMRLDFHNDRTNAILKYAALLIIGTAFFMSGLGVIYFAVESGSLEQFRNKGGTRIVDEGY